MEMSHKQIGDGNGNVRDMETWESPALLLEGTDPLEGEEIPH